MIRAAEYVLYILIVSMIFFILGNYKYQPTLSAEELEAVEEVQELVVVQEGFVEKNESLLSQINVADYNVDAGYSDLLLLVQELLTLDIISGYYNSETEEAFREIQRANNIEETGKLEQETFMSIMEDVLPLSSENLRQHPNLVRLFQRELNLHEDGACGEHTEQSIIKLREEVSDQHNGLVDDAVLAYIIERLDS